MSEWMEYTVQLQEPVRIAIVPTFILPFTVLGMMLTGLATWIAAFFGIKLKAEGPKRLFEILMKPKILAWALVSNALIYGAYTGGQYLFHSSRPLWLIDFNNNNISTHREYPDFKTDLSIRSKVPNFSRPIKNLETVWQAQVKNGVFGGVISSGESLFLGTDGGHFFELDANTGGILRDVWIGQPVATTPVVLNNYVYFGEGVHDTHHARYYKLDLQSGKMISSFPTKGHIERTATVTEIDGNPVLLIPAGSDGVYAVNARTMKKIWQAQVGHVDSFPVTDGKLVYIGTGIEKGFNDTSTKAYAIDLRTGQTKWEKNLPTSAWGMPLLWNRLVCFSVGDVYKNKTYGQLSCYDAEKGDENLSVNIGGAMIAPPVLIGDRLLETDIQGVIYQLNLKEKKIDWQIKVPMKGMNYSGVLMDQEGRLIMPGQDGLYVYSSKTQELLYHWKANDDWNITYSNVLLYKDLWIIADAKGTVRALRPVY